MSKERQRRAAAKDDAAAIDDRTGKSNCPVIVVGIGASAGGLKSLKRLFSKMAPGHGVAFVLIQHLEPSPKNLTVKLLRDQTALAVVEAADGMPVLADRIHVMPPDKFLNITGCRLTLHEPVQCNGLRMPIDHFFCSLGADQRRRGCGIVLSGTGSDGTLGLSEIKTAGGRTLVEDPGSAEFPDVQKSAIDAGVVDAFLPAEAMAEAIVAMAEQVIADTRNDPAESPEFDANLWVILDILRAKVGHDFRCYKPNTLVRRIRRRMTLGKIPTFADYARFLHEHPDEVGLLQKDLLIGVTEFFRQPQAWEILGEKVIAALVENAQAGSEIRVWVPGCSTGKEAYSLAMLLAEQVEKSGKRVGIQIFATDSDAAALVTARSGIYSKEEIGENVSPQRLRRFFTRKDVRYQVTKRIREQIVFAPQNLTADPPFSKLDLISCRNLLIYLEQQVQKKIIALFHFALREGGFLFLGTAETVGDREDLFEPVSKKWRIYRRIGVGRPVSIEIPVRPSRETRPAAGHLPVAASAPRLSLASTAQQMLLDRFAPACVMIDRKLRVLYVHGAVEDYLTFPAGELTTRVVDMAREGLRARLRGAIGTCLEAHRSVSVTARVRRGEKSIPVKATVTPLRYPRETDGLLLIAFEDYRVSAGKSGRQATGKSDVHQLEDELRVTREELQSTIEQLENSNDQLKASNEEVTAANEELQSANEEMETSKEELQSLNEELNTINARLQEKVEELEDINNDIVNLLSSTSIATVFLDKELKVRRYTPASTSLFSLIPSDLGRPIVDVLRRFRDEVLLDDARRVLADLTPLSKEVQAEDSRWYIRRITPYRTQDDRIEGVVVTFVDVSDLKQIEGALREAHERAVWLARFPEENPSPVARVSADGSILYRNPTSAKLPGWLCEVGKSLPDLLLPLVGQAMTEGQEVQQDVELGGRFYSVAVTPFLAQGYANVYGRDITERKWGEEALRESQKDLNRAQAVAHTGSWRLDVRRNELLWSDETHRMFGISQGTPLSYEAFLTTVHPEDRDYVDQKWTAALRGDLYDTEHRIVVGDSVKWVRERAELEFDPQGKLLGGFGTVQDITEHKQAEQALLRAEQEWERTFDAVPDLIAILDDRHRILRANKAMAQRLGLPPDQCAGKLCYQAVHGLDFSPDFCPHTLSLADGREHMAEVHEDYLGGDFLVSTTPLSDEQGRRIGSVHVARDITDRKRAEETLRQRTSELQQLTETLERQVQARTAELVKTNEALHAEIAQRKRAEEAVQAERQRLNDILEVLPAYVVLLTPDYHVPFANRFFRERFGESHGKRCFEYLFGRPEPCEICETYTVLKTNAPHHWEWTGPDGRNYDIFDFPFTDTDGSPLILEMGIDITERKRAEEQVKESAKQLRYLSSRLLSAQEEERKRIAGELHDSIGACLSGIKFRVEKALQQLGRTESAATESLNTIIPVIQEAVEECRRIQMDLRPSMLDDLGLQATLSWFCRRFQKIYSEIQVEQEIDVEEGDVPSPLKVVAFRVIQEAMNNVAKHSHANHVRLSLKKLEGRMELVLEDNGRGFTVDRTRSQEAAGRGLGLLSMRERTELSGGSFGIESAVGKGTIIRASWPLVKE